MRLLLLVLTCQGMRERERNTLVETLEEETDQEAIMSLQWMGINL